MALALDRPAFNTISPRARPSLAPSCYHRRRAAGATARSSRACQVTAASIKDQAEARRIMQSLGYSKERPLKVKVSTRNVARYRDPAVIFIDQMKRHLYRGELRLSIPASGSPECSDATPELSM
jgi:peptide/nickel transport system substrate-binding protein